MRRRNYEFRLIFRCPTMLLTCKLKCILSWRQPFIFHIRSSILSPPLLWSFRSKYIKQFLVDASRTQDKCLIFFGCKSRRHTIRRWWWTMRLQFIWVFGYYDIQQVSFDKFTNFWWYKKTRKSIIVSNDKKMSNFSHFFHYNFAILWTRMYKGWRKESETCFELELNESV